MGRGSFFEDKHRLTGRARSQLSAAKEPQSCTGVHKVGREGRTHLPRSRDNRIH